MRHNIKRNTVVLVAIGIIIAFICSLTHIDSLFSNIIKTVLSPAVSVASKVSEKINSIDAYFISNSVYKTQLENMSKALARTKQDARQSESYRQENDRLKAELDLSHNLESDYEGQVARVISYEPNNWFDTLVINKGQISGIYVGCPVISNEGLVGRVTDVGLNWANIETILNTNSAIYASSTSTNGVAVVEGDVKLAKAKRCKMNYIQEDAVFMEGHYLETSGYGDVYPAGLKIGYIKELANDESGTKYGVVEPTVNFNTLSEVTVMVKK